MRQYVRQWQEVFDPLRWTPCVPGETFEGTYLGTEKRGGENCSYPVVLLQDNKGMSFFLASTVAHKRVAYAGFRPGDPIRIEYIGSYITNSGHECRDFKVYRAL